MHSHVQAFALLASIYASHIIPIPSLDARQPTVTVSITARSALPLPTSSKRSDSDLWRNGRRGLNYSPAAPTVFIRRPISLTQTRGWQSLGCYKDSASARILRTQKSAKIIGGVTIEHCQAGCLSASFKYAGIEYGEECWRDKNAPLDSQKEFPNSMITGPSGCEKPIALPCAANTSQVCGAGDRIYIYFFGLVPIPSNSQNISAASNITRSPFPPNLPNTEIPSSFSGASSVPSKTPTATNNRPPPPEVTGSGTTNSDTPNPGTTGSDTTGSNTAESDTAGSDTAGSDGADSDATGSKPVDTDDTDSGTDNDGNATLKMEL